MRTVSFPNSTKWEFQGNVHQAAVCLGDLDMDGGAEFAVGSSNGFLSVFKGLEFSKPWKSASGLETISCLAIGDVLNIGRNHLLCISHEGACSIFEFLGDSTQRKADSEPQMEAPVIIQPVPANIDRVLIGDVDGDGLNELVVTRTDRVLHVFKLTLDENAEHEGDLLKMIDAGKYQLPGQAGSLTLGYDDKGLPQLVVAQPGGTFLSIDHTGTMQENPLLSSSTSSSISSLGAHTEIVCANNSLSKPATINVLKSTPGISIHSIKSSFAQSSATLNSTTTMVPKPKSLPTTSPRHSAMPAFLMRFSSRSPPSGGFQNPSPASLETQEPRPRVSSSQGLLSPLEGSRPVIAPTGPAEFCLITVEGLVQFHASAKNIWKMQVDHQLFSLARLDVSNHPQGDIAMCSWDGLTYIVDRDQGAVRFQFPGSVSAFTAGHFGTHPGVNSPCLFYVDYNDRITVYHDLDLPSLKSPNLIETLSNDPMLPEILKLIGETPQSLEGEGKREKVSAFLAEVLRKANSPEDLPHIIKEFSS